MIHLWSLLAREVITDTRTNNVSFINIIERISFTSDPKRKSPKPPFSVPVSLFLVTTWMRSELEKPEFGHARVRIKDPLGKNLRASQSVEYDIDLSEAINFRATVGFPVFPFTTSGMYVVSTQLRDGRKWTDSGIAPLQIIDNTPNPQ